MKRAKAVPQPLEFVSHIAVADHLRAACKPRWLWSHFPAGEHRNAATGARLKRMGLKRGWSDFVLISPFALVHWLEMKRGKAPLTEDQEAFRDACREIGVPWALARSVDEALAQLVDWGALPRSVLT